MEFPKSLNIQASTRKIAHTYTQQVHTHTHLSSTAPKRQNVQHPIQRGTNSPCIQTHEILNKSIMCRQTNNKQDNCLILSITHNTMKLKICQLRTHTHTKYTHARTRTRAHKHSINTFWTIHKTIHLHHFPLTNVLLCCTFSRCECEHHLQMWLLSIS